MMLMMILLLIALVSFTIGMYFVAKELHDERRKEEREDDT